MKYSPYQEKIFEFFSGAQGNLMVQAFAGSGKTTTALEGMRRVVDRKDKIFLAFNRAIAQEIREKLDAAGDRTTRVATYHAFGLSQLGKVRIDGDKLKPIIKKFCFCNGNFQDTECF